MPPSSEREGPSNTHSQVALATCLPAKHQARSLRSRAQGWEFPGNSPRHLGPGGAGGAKGPEVLAGNSRGMFTNSSPQCKWFSDIGCNIYSKHQGKVHNHMEGLPHQLGEKGASLGLCKHRRPGPPPS